MKEIVLAFDVIIEPDQLGFHAYCPALKGLHVGGDTADEALQNARDAINAYIRSLIKHGDPIPVGVQIAEEDGDVLARDVRHHTEHLKLVLANA